MIVATLTSCLALTCIVASPEQPVTSSGTLVGRVVQTSHGEVRQLLGVRYCEAPLTLHENDKSVNEDCLFLNVFLPVTPAPANQPIRAIMVWIPGEGFGFADAAQFDGSYLAVRGDVIVITVNYRVGVFGFLSTGNSSVPGNHGLWDVLEALRWVRRNAAALGGDPARVTLFGRFTGAMIASLLLTSPYINQRDATGRPSPLVARVILQSGVGFGNYVLDEEPANRTDTLAHLAGCEGTHQQVMAGISCLCYCRLWLVSVVCVIAGDDLCQLSVLLQVMDCVSCLCYCRLWLVSVVCVIAGGGLYQLSVLLQVVASVSCGGLYQLSVLLQVMACLRAVPSGRLDQLSWQVPQLWRPVVDGTLITTDPLRAIRRAAYDRGVQIMIGETGGEGSICLLQHYYLETVFSRAILADNVTKREFVQLVQEHVYDYLKCMALGTKPEYGLSNPVLWEPPVPLPSLNTHILAPDISIIYDQFSMNDYQCTALGTKPEYGLSNSVLWEPPFPLPSLNTHILAPDISIN
uniref:Carboxylesterase type B domain-containing protein n=1 Tax=Timema cristinae TaxID=61476 RepID=A0A7R9DAJ9_TIMCR|nr:unnamed protein product [Timema cristinae]